jgi:accessory gene regulator protein AgrB
MGEFNWGNAAGGIFISVVVIVVIFLVFREFFCWYWKINQRIALLSEIRSLLAAKSMAPVGTTQSSLPTAALRTCKECGSTITDAGSTFCTQCGAKL